MILKDMHACMFVLHTTINAAVFTVRLVRSSQSAVNSMNFFDMLQNGSFRVKKTVTGFAVRHIVTVKYFISSQWIFEIIKTKSAILR
mmetsp:Transcript_17926/g.23750  ORF Transcript_17926/g.23750 Transcript_17926/m.23750 type:complete len:87 (-) Transcript_17926:79-339(-)